MSMNKGRSLHHITAQALVPEQILPYVAAVGASKAVLFADCVGHVYGNSVVLVAYPPESENYFNSPADTSINPTVHNTIVKEVDAAVSAVYANPAYTHITVLAPVRPSSAPNTEKAASTTTATSPATSQNSPISPVSSVSPETSASPAPPNAPNFPVPQDMFWSIPLPSRAALTHGQKLRNMLRRAHQDSTINTSRQWTTAHAALATHYCQSRPLPAGTRHIFQHLGDYVRDCPDAIVFSAHSRVDNSLLACAIGDFSSMTTAMYMFAFRQPTAPPGTSDALLNALCAEGQARGHSRLNLGLGINTGISFFKHKWQAQPFLPYVESTWQIKQQSWWSKIFS